MRLFKCIIDAGDNVFKAYTTGRTKKEMLNNYGWWKKFLKIEDVTSNYLNQDSIEQLEIDLIDKSWNEAERVIILALIRQHIDSRK